MASSAFLLLILLLLNFLYASECAASRKLAAVYHPPATVLTFHNGALLEGSIPVSILWYGRFSPSQRAIVADFLLSLTPPHRPTTFPAAAHTVARWWRTVDLYLQKAGRRRTHVLLANQVLDEACSLGLRLSRRQLADLARGLGVMPGGVTLVLTAADVAIEGFCSSACGLHGSIGQEPNRAAYIWVGNSEAQCPGQCAWPFHDPVYGPTGPVLRAPNLDVGLDGMVINLATLLAGAVTNPYGDGYFEGHPAMAVEVGGACAGVYGQGAFPGYAGKLKMDWKTRGSYNVEGEKGRKYLVPTLLNPISHSCSVTT